MILIEFIRISYFIRIISRIVIDSRMKPGYGFPCLMVRLVNISIEKLRDSEHPQEGTKTNRLSVSEDSNTINDDLTNGEKDVAPGMFLV